ncbi:UDP-2,3-diacylglucosamine pyrophosphatase LpxH [Salibacterium salarium]|uniref:hypothetical protein n=1 Tax=Salibacterium salarium TaxID=284579 RepID=UPI002785734A|nr:hypothetical protein [Salibacterium salarium]MDQ0300339.1 UDP-2,3-diacylglucosamine pyrophosphatase LpxH [Salibacterium salarium]
MSKNGARQEKSLRVVAPDIYNKLIQELETYHIQPYDIQANAIEYKDGLQLILYYGEQFPHLEKKFASFEEWSDWTADLSTFIELTAQTLKQTMVADYFKMMRM